MVNLKKINSLRKHRDKESDVYSVCALDIKICDLSYIVLVYQWFGCYNWMI